MKIITTLCTLIWAASALSDSINPERSIYTYLQIFDAKVYDNGAVVIPTAKYDREGTITQNAHKVTLHKQVYDRFLGLSEAVFEMNPPSGRRGTAFHIGHNLVLTNNHVLDPEFKNQTKCAAFNLKDHETGARYNCKKVHFCDKNLDMCLIEMEKAKIYGCSVPMFCKHDFTEKELASSPKLRLRENFRPEMNLRDDMVMTVIGNSQGLGIHLSQGRGLKFSGQNFVFYAGVTGGNSGGPLINEQDEVVGIVKWESKEVLVGFGAYNTAVGMDAVLKALRENVKDADILGKLEEAVIQ